jgi:large conductance mechanosensitive channel
MVRQFRDFLLSTNALALAVAVIIGGAVGKVVSSMVSDVLMPIIGLIIPGGEWRTIKIVLTHNADGSAANAIMLGSFIGTLIDFSIISLCVFLITKAILKPAPAGPPPPPTKMCPQCLEQFAKDAKRCRYCTSTLT